MKSFKKFHGKLSKIKLSVLCGVVALMAVFLCTKVIQADINSNMFGYWGSLNAGLIKMNDCDNLADGTTCNPNSSYGASVSPTGTLTGFAWSSNLGWIMFDPAVGCPTAGCTPGAHVEWTTPNVNGVIKGWARVCSVYQNGCGGPLRDNAYLGYGAGATCDSSAGPSAPCEWDGYIALDSATAGGVPGWGLQINNDVIGGYAWGSQVLGWITSITGKVYLGGPTVSLTSDKDDIDNGNSCSATAGGSATLTVTAGNIDNSSACTLVGMAGSLVMKQQADSSWVGTIAVSPASKTTYTVNCVKNGQTATASKTIDVTRFCPTGTEADGVDSTDSTATGTGTDATGGSATGGSATATGGSATGNTSSGPGTGGYCTNDYPSFSWDGGDSTSCTVSANGTSVAVPISTDEVSEDGTHRGTLGADGLYYVAIPIKISGTSTSYTLQCTGGKKDINIQQTVRSCDLDYSLQSADVSPTLTPIGDGTVSTATYTISVLPQDGFTDPVNLSVLSWSSLIPNTKSGSFSPSIRAAFDGSKYGNIQFTVSVPTVDLKTIITHAPIVIQGISEGSNKIHQVTVFLGAAIKIKPKFNEF